MSGYLETAAMRDTPRKSVLVCDDDPDVRKTLALVLAGLYDVSQARDGREALDVISSRPIDLVLLDVCMPRMGGLAALKAYRAAHRGIATIMLTGRRGRRLQPEEAGTSIAYAPYPPDGRA